MTVRPAQPHVRPLEFGGRRPSGYVAPVHLFTSANIDKDGGAQNSFDPGNGYKDQYKKIWGAN